MEIRKAQNRDTDIILHYDKHITKDELINSINLSRVYIALENDQFCGWLRYNLFWDNTPFMNMLYILDGFRGKNIGRQMVDIWENDMRLSGFRFVLTSTLSNETAQHFYTHLGYETIGGFTLKNEPFEMIMMKNI